MFEVEKKFKVTEDFDRRLLEHGWKYLKDVHFTDTYYDSDSYILTLNDYWLRKRDKQWELKCPLSLQEQQGSVKVDKYQEISKETEIIEHLSLNPKVNSGCLQDKKSVEDAIEVLGIQPIATFETFRTKFEFPGGFHIDLDKTNFGYQVGEIELLCQRKDEVEETTAKILDMGGKLGVNINNNLTGKVGTYLKRNRKHHYDLLIKAGVLVAETE